MNARKLKSMELMEVRRQDNDYYYLAPNLVLLVETENTKWTLDWHGGASVKVSDGGFCQIRSHTGVLQVENGQKSQF